MPYGPSPGQAAALAPGILWVSFAFAATLAMNRAFAREQEAGALEGLLVSPVSRDAIFLAKAATSFIFMLLVEAALLPAYAVMLQFSALSWTLGAVIALATLAFALIGTLFSAMAAQTRSREIMLPVLFFPIITPVIIAAVAASNRGRGRRDIHGTGPLAAPDWRIRRPFSGNMSVGFFIHSRGLTSFGEYRQNRPPEVTPPP